MMGAVTGVVTALISFLYVKLLQIGNYIQVLTVLTYFQL